MIRAPLPVIEQDDELELASKKDGPDHYKPKNHRSANSLSESDFGHGSEEPEQNEDHVIADAENADDEVEEPLDYEEQKRRRSFERKVHRQTQRRGSVEDYEQSDDVQFVQRIQSYNSLTGKEISRLQTASPNSVKKYAPVPRHEPSQQSPKNASPGHQRKNTLDLWKEKAAQMKNTPAFPPHQTSISSHAQAANSKSKKPAKFQSLAEESEHDGQECDGDNYFQYPDETPKKEAKSHARSPTLQEWKSHAEQVTMTQDVSAEHDNDFTTIEDQSWAKNVKCGDTLKRFKQNQPRSIATSDFFSAPTTLDTNESIVEESESASLNADTLSDGSNCPISDDGNGKDPLMRELIRDCLRVIATMSQSGLINQKQKLALKGLALRKDKKIVEIAKLFRQVKNNAQHADDRDVIMHDMELAFARFACNIN